MIEDLGGTNNLADELEASFNFSYHDTFEVYQFIWKYRYPDEPMSPDLRRKYKHFYRMISAWMHERAVEPLEFTRDERYSVGYWSIHFNCAYELYSRIIAVGIAPPAAAMEFKLTFA